jgi:hypothetical protein
LLGARACERVVWNVVKGRDCTVDVTVTVVGIVVVLGDAVPARRQEHALVMTAVPQAEAYVGITKGADAVRL